MCHPVINEEFMPLNGRSEAIIFSKTVRMEGCWINRGGSFRHVIPLKGGDGREILGKAFQYVVGGAIENVSSMTGRSYAREAMGKAHELSYVKVFGAPCRRDLGKDDSSRR